MPRTHALDLAGRRYGRLTVIRETDDRAVNGQIAWECRCDCGGRARVSTASLTTGNTRSCGCWQREISSRPNGGRRR